MCLVLRVFLLLLVCCKLAAHYPDFDPCQRDPGLRQALQVKRRIGISVCRGDGDKTGGREGYARELFLEQQGSSVSCGIVTFVGGSRGIGIS